MREREVVCLVVRECAGVCGSVRECTGVCSAGDVQESVLTSPALTSLTTDF